MKKLLVSVVAVVIVSQCFSQAKSDITTRNSWFKLGVNTGLPLGDFVDSNHNTFAAGIEVSGQWMVTKYFGLGISSGYTHFFAEENYTSFGTIPLDLMLRFYPKSKGIFIGANTGYTFITNIDNIEGGFNIMPQLGYHNYSWNIYGFYNHIFGEQSMNDIQNVGIAATYNLRFSKKK